MRSKFYFTLCLVPFAMLIFGSLWLCLHDLVHATNPEPEAISYGVEQTEPDHCLYRRDVEQQARLLHYYQQVEAQEQGIDTPAPAP